MRCVLVGVTCVLCLIVSRVVILVMIVLCTLLMT